MLKLTLPDQDDFYAELIAHPKVLRVVALSGGYTRDEANAKLARNHGMIASFSRALADDLRPSRATRSSTPRSTRRSSIALRQDLTAAR